MEGRNITESEEFVNSMGGMCTNPLISVKFQERYLNNKKVYRRSFNAVGPPSHVSGKILRWTRFYRAANTQERFGLQRWTTVFWKAFGTGCRDHQIVRIPGGNTESMRGQWRAPDFSMGGAIFSENCWIPPRSSFRNPLSPWTVVETMKTNLFHPPSYQIVHSMILQT